MTLNQVEVRLGSERVSVNSHTAKRLKATLMLSKIFATRKFRNESAGYDSAAAALSRKAVVFERFDMISFCSKLFRYFRTFLEKQLFIMTFQKPACNSRIATCNPASGCELT